MSRHHQRSLQAEGSKNTLIAQPLDDSAASLAILRCRPPCFVGGKGLAGQRGRFQWNGLRGRGKFAGKIALRLRSRYNGAERHAGIAVYLVKQTGFVCVTLSWIQMAYASLY